MSQDLPLHAASECATLSPFADLPYAETPLLLDQWHAAIALADLTNCADQRDACAHTDLDHAPQSHALASADLAALATPAVLSFHLTKNTSS